MKIIFLVLLLLPVFSCSQMKLAVDGEERSDIEIVSRGKYREIHGAGDLLRKVESTTLMVTFRQTGQQNHPQDLIAFSIGGSDKKTLASRASMRMDREGYLTGIARATDSESAHTIRAKEKIPAGEFHNAALVIDYSKNEMHLFLDGKPIETVGTIAFSKQETDDTPSINATIGAEDNGSENFFEGEIQRPMIWRRRLKPEEILQLAKP